MRWPALGVRGVKGLRIGTVLRWAVVCAVVLLSALALGLWLAPGHVMGFLISDSAALWILEGWYGPVQQPRTPTGEVVHVWVKEAKPIHTVSRRYLSVAIDTSQVVGGHWWHPKGDRIEVGRGSTMTEPFDFERAELIERAKALSPAFLRIGGTEADHVGYAMGTSPSQDRPLFELELTEAQWRAIHEFARSTDLEIVFTVNAGPSSRRDGQWTLDNAERLFRYTRDSGYKVWGWELGNEVNAYWFIHGATDQVSPAQYALDLKRLRGLRDRYTPDAKLLGPATFFWPMMGQPLSGWVGGIEDFLQAGAAPHLDVITWHFYPQQSRRCPGATRRAKLDTLLNPVHLDEVAVWGGHVKEVRDRLAPDAALWLGETGHAQCGGEPGLSDRFVSSLWWLDQLGSVAQLEHAVVIRQTLVGSQYGLLETRTLEPRPDYWASVLFKGLMGRRVLRTEGSPSNPYVRVYAHCDGEGKSGAASLLLLNVHGKQDAVLRLPGWERHAAQRYLVTADALHSRAIRINGVPVVGDPLSMGRAQRDPLVELPAASYAFLSFPEAAIDACR